MDVFLQDPIVDWVESCASKRPSEGDEDDDGDSDDDGDDGAGAAAEGGGGKRRGSKGAAQAAAAKRPLWEPVRRIRNARRKLEGVNPVDLLLDDLKQVRPCGGNADRRVGKPSTCAPGVLLLTSFVLGRAPSACRTRPWRGSRAFQPSCIFSEERPRPRRRRPSPRAWPPLGAAWSPRYRAECSGWRIRWRAS